MEENISKKHESSKIMQKLQKPIIFTLFSLSIILFAYSLIFFTPFYDLYVTDGSFLTRNMTNYGLNISDYADAALLKRNDRVLGISMEYFTNFVRKGYGLQEFDHTLFLLGFIGILIGLVVFLYAGQKRRRYYLSNYISIGASSAYSIGVGVYAFINLLSWHNYVKTSVDFKTINAYLSYSNALKDSDGNAMVKEYFTASSFNYVFIIGYIICALFVIAGIVAILYLVNKAVAQKRHPGLDLSGVNIDE